MGGANYTTDRTQRELIGLSALQEEVPEPDEDASEATPQQKRRRFDKLEIIAEDLGLALTAEERTFYGAVSKDQDPPTREWKLCPREPDQRTGSGAVGEGDGLGRVSQGASIASREPGLLPANPHFVSIISANGSESTSHARTVVGQKQLAAE